MCHLEHFDPDLHQLSYQVSVVCPLDLVASNSREWRLLGYCVPVDHRVWINQFHTLIVFCLNPAHVSGVPALRLCIIWIKNILFDQGQNMCHPQRLMLKWLCEISLKDGWSLKLQLMVIDLDSNLYSLKPWVRLWEQECLSVGNTVSSWCWIRIL